MCFGGILQKPVPKSTHAFWEASSQAPLLKNSLFCRHRTTLFCPPCWQNSHRDPHPGHAALGQHLPVAFHHLGGGPQRDHLSSSSLCSSGGSGGYGLLVHHHDHVRLPHRRSSRRSRGAPVPLRSGRGHVTNAIPAALLRAPPSNLLMTLAGPDRSGDNGDSGGGGCHQACRGVLFLVVLSVSPSNPQDLKPKKERNKKKYLNKAATPPKKTSEDIVPEYK